MFNQKILAEQGEVFKAPNGQIQKISNNAPSHDDDKRINKFGINRVNKGDGGVEIDADSVLSDSYRQVENGNRENNVKEQIVKIKPIEGESIAGQLGLDIRLKKAVSPSQLFLAIQKAKDKQTLSILGKSKNTTDTREGSNSNAVNASQLSTLPTDEEIYNAVFEHTEEKKEQSGIDFEQEAQAQYGNYNISKELDKKYDIPSQRSFLSINLAKRFKQLGENMGTSDSDKIKKEYDRQTKNMYDSFITDSAFDVSKRAGKYVYNNDKDFFREQMDYENKVFRDALLNSDTRRGSYYRGHNTILLNPKIQRENVDENSTALHELSHSLQATPQQNKIKSFIPLKDKYYDNPDEVYSRRNQFIKANSINPNKKYTPQEIKTLRENKNTKDFDLLNRYNNQQILKLLNDVAFNSKEKFNITTIAQYGKKSILSELNLL